MDQYGEGRSTHPAAGKVAGIVGWQGNLRQIGYPL
jgi:hypothetical protein